MEEKFIKNKFANSGTVLIRQEILSNGKIIVFGIAISDLTTLPSNIEINFDKESDEILKTFHNSPNNMAFQYGPNSGFNNVDVSKQSWFIF